MRISELADTAGVPVSTVRYYERVGLLGTPARTASGYRDYDEEAGTRLLFVLRARRLGLSCEQVAQLVSSWGGTNCTLAHEEVSRLIDDKQAEIAARIEGLAAFASQLENARATLESMPPQHACRTDLTCCVPAGPTELVSVEIGSVRRGVSR